jgi:acyl-CoA synthetase (AMP-forming)/AMP-acid ligase II
MSKLDFESCLPNQTWDKSIPYGKRLIVQVVDERARTNPERIVGRIAKAADVSKGFTDVTIGDVARATDYMAAWLQERIQKTRDFEPIAYMGPNDFRYWIMIFAGIKIGNPVRFPKPGFKVLTLKHHRYSSHP